MRVRHSLEEASLNCFRWKSCFSFFFLSTFPILEASLSPSTNWRLETNWVRARGKVFRVNSRTESLQHFQRSWPVATNEWQKPQNIDSLLALKRDHKGAVNIDTFCNTWSFFLFYRKKDMFSELFKASGDFGKSKREKGIRPKMPGKSAEKANFNIGRRYLRFAHSLCSPPIRFFSVRKTAVICSSFLSEDNSNWKP